MPARWKATTLATALLAGLLSFSGPVTGTARATDGRAAAVGTAAAATPSGYSSPSAGSSSSYDEITTSPGGPSSVSL